MKLKISKVVRRNLLLSAVGVTSLLHTGCALPSKEQWAQVQARGLIPVLIDANRSDAPVTTPIMRPSQQSTVLVQAGRPAPATWRTPTAVMVGDRPGFVYSPHTAPRKMVDVRRFQAGEEVRCPYTSQTFIVPGAAVIASTPAYRPPVESHPVNRTVPNVPPVDPGLAHLEPVVTPTVSPAPAVDPPKPPVKPVANTAANTPPVDKASVPYGTRVAGRPGYVYSPHAGKTQLVNVVDVAPGVVVKCPYSNKLFRVPEPVTEEIKPETFPATETASTPPPPVEKKEVSPAPAPVPPGPVNPGGALGAPPPR